MKRIKLKYIAACFFVALAVSACKENVDFVAENVVHTGVGYYPVSTNTLTDIATKANIPAAAGYDKDQLITWELQYWSLSPIKEINLYETIGTGTRTLKANYPYKAAYSTLKAADTLIITYRVPVAPIVATGTNIKLETEIVNANTLNLLRTVTIKVK